MVLKEAGDPPPSPAGAAAAAGDSRRIVTVLKVVLWIGGLAPVAWLGVGLPLGWLGANPIERMTHVTGLTALILLLLTLAVTPVRRLTGWNPLIRLRRPLGLFAFFHAALHFGIWVVLDLNFRLDWVGGEIVERPFITVGFLAFLILVPLAATSTKGWIRRLGRRWALLHRAIYPAAALAVLHYAWGQKADIRLPLVAAGFLALLLALRISRWRKKRSVAPGRTPPGY